MIIQEYAYMALQNVKTTEKFVGLEVRKDGSRD